MGVYDKIKELAAQRKISIAQLERNLDISNGSISKWKNSHPNSEPLRKIADYFNVSVDYLLERQKTNDSADEIASYFRTVTSSVEMDDEEEKEFEDDFKAYLDMRAELLRKRRGK